MSQERIVVFVCEHGAAKSIIAATHFNELSRKSGLNWKALARGTNPDEELSQQSVMGLAKDGLVPVEPVPKRLSTNDVQSAQRMVSFCEIPIEYGGAAILEQWNYVPPVSQDYERSRDSILNHIQDLLHRIRSLE